MPQEFSPKHRILQTLSLWWVLVCTILLGGLIGFAIHHIHPPIYQAKATLFTFIDYQKITDVLLSEYDEDMTINTIQSVMLSNDVVGEVLTRAASEGIPLDYATFMHQMSIFRKFTDYEIYYRDRNPEVAQKIVNNWMEIGFQQIKQLQHDGNLPLYLTINLGDLAVLPQNPTYSQTNTYVLSGAVLGLVLGIILTSDPFSAVFINKTSDNKKIKRVA